MREWVELKRLSGTLLLDGRYVVDIVGKNVNQWVRPVLERLQKEALYNNHFAADFGCSTIFQNSESPVFRGL